MPAPLHVWREAAQMSVEELAVAAGVSLRSAKLALAGERVGMKVAMKLAELTGIDLAELLAGVEFE